MFFFFKLDILLFEVKHEQRVLHFTETDGITAGTINNFDFTPSQYCFKQQQQLRHQIFLQTMFHKLDSKDQIIYFSIYARWSCFCSWLQLLILFVYLFGFLKLRGFLSF